MPATYLLLASAVQYIWWWKGIVVCFDPYYNQHCNLLAVSGDEVRRSEMGDCRSLESPDHCGSLSSKCHSCQPSPGTTL